VVLVGGNERRPNTESRIRGRPADNRGGGSPAERYGSVHHAGNARWPPNGVGEIAREWSESAADHGAGAKRHDELRE
jgi:hypothetical protein